MNVVYDAAPLKNDGDAVLRGRVAAQVCERTAAHLDASLLDPCHTAQRVDHGRLADSVSAHQRHSLTRVHGEGDAVEDASVAVERVHAMKS